MTKIKLHIFVVLYYIEDFIPGKLFIIFKIYVAGGPQVILKTNSCLFQKSKRELG